MRVVAAITPSMIGVPGVAVVCRTDARLPQACSSTGTSSKALMISSAGTISSVALRPSASPQPVRPRSTTQIGGEQLAVVLTSDDHGVGLELHPGSTASIPSRTGVMGAPPSALKRSASSVSRLMLMRRSHRGERLGTLWAEQRAVGGDRQVVNAYRPDRGDHVREISTQERLASCKPNRPNPDRRQDAHHACELTRREVISRGLARLLASLRSTVWTAKLTAVRERDADIPQAPIAEVFESWGGPVHGGSIARRRTRTLDRRANCRT